MTCTKRYACDLCRDDLRTDTDGIGIKWEARDKIAHVFWANSEHHLCNRCLAGLRKMLAGLDRMTEMYRKLDAPEEDDVAAAEAAP